jgi:hypothetical protein
MEMGFEVLTHPDSTPAASIPSRCSEVLRSWVQVHPQMHASSCLLQTCFLMCKMGVGVGSLSCNLLFK